MGNKSSSNSPKQGSSWATFKPGPGGAARDIRREAASIKTKVNEEKKVFGAASIINGGRWEK